MKPTRSNSSYAKCTLWVCLTCLLLSVQAQYNLVQNPSFEVLDKCPDSLHSEANYAAGWDKPKNGGVPGGLIFSRCANLIPNPKYGIPSNWYGEAYQESRSGDGYGYIGIFQFSSSLPNFSYRGYIQNHLLDTLKPEQIYCVRMWVSLFNKSLCVLDEVGIYFDDGSVTRTQPSGYAAVNPQVKSPTMVFLSDTLNWMLIEGTFKAVGSEQYLTIGNFRDNQQTNFQSTSFYGQNGYWDAGYYIDDVSVIPSDLPAFAGNDTLLLNAGDSIFLGRLPEIGLECVWYDMQGNPLGQGAGMWVVAGHTASYIVEQNLCGNIKRDTVTVYVGVGAADSPEMQSIGLYPNPSGGSFSLSLPTGVGMLRLRLCEPSGRELWRGLHTGSETHSPPVAAGVYVLHIEEAATGRQAVRRLVVR